MLVIVIGWAWFGVAGCVPLVLWWWHRRPPAGIPAALWHVDLAEVCTAHLGPWRVRITRRREAPLEIFCDELPPADLARLRRELKAWLAR